MSSKMWYHSVFSFSSWALLFVYVISVFLLKKWMEGNYELQVTNRVMSYCYGGPALALFIYFIWIPSGSSIFRHSFLDQSKTAKFVSFLERYRKIVEGFFDAVDDKIYRLSR